MVKLWNEISHFVQHEKESFQKCFEWFKHLLARCPRHGLERWRLCQIIYEGLNQATKTTVNCMCPRGFLNKSETKAWDFLEESAENTLQWNTTWDESLGARINSQRGGWHTVTNTICIDTRFAALKYMVKSLMLSQTTSNHPPSPNGLMSSMSIH